MKLLARWDRKPRRAERGFKLGGQRQRMTFEMAMLLLHNGLKALGLLPPPAEAETEQGAGSSKLSLGSGDA